MSIIEGVTHPGVISGTARHPESRVIYVEPGTDALQEAIDSAVDDVGDVIVLRPGSHTVTEKVEFNKKGLIVIAADVGYAPNARGELFTVRADAGFTDGPVAEITRPTAIIGLGFWGRESAETSVLMSFGTGGFNSGGWSYLKKCWFPNHGGIARALDLVSVDRVLVDGCVFDGSNNGALSASGKRLTAGIKMTQGHNVYIRGCEFINAVTAIDLAVIAPQSDPVHGNTGCVVQANRFLGVADTHLFLNVEGVTAVRPQKTLVMDNWLGLANTKTYGLDGSLDSVANLTTEGLAFAGNHYAE